VLLSAEEKKVLGVNRAIYNIGRCEAVNVINVDLLVHSEGE
jgi:hypothetical protein